jgi:hypothetical protein
VRQKAALFLLVFFLAVPHLIVSQDGHQGDEGAPDKAGIGQQGYWIKKLIDFEIFYRNHPPFELVYTSKPTIKVPADYGKETVDFEFSIGLRHKNVETMQKALNDILKELRQTDYKKNQWGLDGWPAISAESTKKDQIRTDVFEGYRTFTVKVALFNNNDESAATLEFPLYGQLKLKSGNTIGAVSTQERRMTITVKGDLLTNDMQIRLVSINGVDADKSNVDAYVKNYTVKKMPVRSRTTISNNDILFPELSEEKDKRLAAEVKTKTKQAEWDAKPLQKRKGLSVSALYNPPLRDNWRNALSLEGGLGLGYKNFSIDSKFVSSIDSIMNQSEGAGELVYGVGFAGGYSFVWKHFVLCMEGGFTFYSDNNLGTSAVLPLIEGKFDMVPGRAGLALRIGYKLEFGSPQENKFCNYYFGKNNSFGTDSLRMVGNPTAGLVLWF